MGITTKPNGFLNEFLKYKTKTNKTHKFENIILILKHLQPTTLKMTCTLKLVAFM